MSKEYEHTPKEMAEKFEILAHYFDLMFMDSTFK